MSRKGVTGAHKEDGMKNGRNGTATDATNVSPGKPSCTVPPKTPDAIPAGTTGKVSGKTPIKLSKGLPGAAPATGKPSGAVTTKAPDGEGTVPTKAPDGGGAALALLGVFLIDEEGTEERGGAERSFFTLACHLAAEDAHLTVGGTRYDIAPGQVILLPPGVPYRRRARSGRIIVLQFSAPGLSETVRVLSVQDSLPLVARFTEARRIWGARAAGYRYRTLAGLAELLAALPEPPAKHTPLVEKAIARMEASFTDPAFSILSLAKELSVSGTYLRRVFTQELGTPPKQYLSDLRFARAAALLSSRLVTVAEAAEASGFRSGANFSTAYRLRFGYSPREQCHKTVFS